MENTFSTLYQEYRCKNQNQAFDTLKYIFNDVGDPKYWIRKIKIIQEGVFGINAEFNSCSPDSLIYAGQLFLKVIYASHHFQQVGPISKTELDWKHLVCPWNDARAKRNQEGSSLFQLLDYCPKSLSLKQILDPASFIQDFYSVSTLKEWVCRWNQFREYAFYQYSMMDGDEGSYLFDFEYLYKLTEACYLIYARHAQATPKDPSTFAS
ncbi:hypothetical protein [Algoriphagus halophytocola]|uniref:Uncharacterized protein n=1 Tax=Algoriphagus halophytocola TaxID=2991499 RepID=A0ABY6MKP9_9BACT|nr:hypothetical protein [Algoriphagus sp. TR-M5]UZD24353.1 hypothetical protein OM944_07590 [Algoriphagus sp. TR-M5]